MAGRCSFSYVRFVVGFYQLVMRLQRSIKLLQQKKNFDFWIILFPIILSLFGIVMIYEASNVAAFRDFGDKYHFIKDQFTWFAIGIVMLFAASFISYKKYYSSSVPILIISLIFLIAVYIPKIGIKILGAKRWVGTGIFTFQPSEFAKLAVILYLSSWFSVKEKKRLFAFLLLFCLVVGLVVLQPDLGTAVILTCIFLSMYFLSGASILHSLIMVPLVGLVVLGLTIISPYRLARLLSFMNPNLDPLGASYHIRQILIALGSGGIWGLGIGASLQKYQFLPEATTDSIFAIIAEELGFIGASLLIICFLIFFFRIFQVAKHAPNKHAFLLSSGILVLFSSQTLINLGAMVALFPLTGVPLPFISYGGSNLIISMIAVGIMLNISRQSILKK